MGSVRRQEDGVALVEFALVAPLLLVLLFGMLEFGRAFNYWIDATHLANEGARWAVVNKNPASSGTLQNYIRQQAGTNELRAGGSTAIPDALVVCISFPVDSDGTSGQIGDPVEVTASVDYHWMPALGDLIDKLGGNDLATTTVTSSSTMRIEAAHTNYSAGSGGTGTCPS
jgi:Flp pilus assembly protein TadG